MTELCYATADDDRRPCGYRLVRNKRGTVCLNEQVAHQKVWVDPPEDSSRREGWYEYRRLT